MNKAATPNQSLERTAGRSHDAVIRVYDAAGNVIETHEYADDFKGAVSLLVRACRAKRAVAATCALTPDSRFFLRFIATGNTRINARVTSRRRF
jgi:hypothetical protein